MIRTIRDAELEIEAQKRTLDTLKRELNSWLNKAKTAVVGKDGEKGEKGEKGEPGSGGEGTEGPMGPIGPKEIKVILQLFKRKVYLYQFVLF